MRVRLTRLGKGYGVMIGAMLWLMSQLAVYHYYLDKRLHLMELRDQRLMQITQWVNGQMQMAVTQNNALAELVEKTGDTQDLLLKEMNRRADTHYASRLRFGWTNEHAQLILGSISGPVEPPMDLSHRAYVRSAKAEPKKLHFDAVDHAVYDRLVLVAAQGVTREGSYVGAIAAIVDMETLRQSIEQIIKGYPVIAHLHSLDGHMLYSPVQHEAHTVKQTTEEGFLEVSISLRNAALDVLIWNALLISLITTLLLALVFSGLRHLMQRMQRRTSHEIVHTVQEALGLDVTGGRHVSDVSETTGHIRDLLQTHLDAKRETEHYKEQLDEAMQLIRVFQQEQGHFFASVNTEIEAVVDALEAYGDLLQERRPLLADVRQYLPHHAAKLYDLEAEGADSLLYVKEQMQFLSQALHAMCRHVNSADSGEQETIDIACLMRSILNEYSEFLGILFRYEGPDSSGCMVAEEDAYLVLSSLIYSLHKASDKALDVPIMLAAYLDRVEIKSEFLLVERLNEKNALSVFEPPQNMLVQMKQDVMWFVLRYFVRKLGATLEVEALGDTAHITITIPTSGE